MPASGYWQRLGACGVAVSASRCLAITEEVLPHRVVRWALSLAWRLCDGMDFAFLKTVEVADVVSDSARGADGLHLSHAGDQMRPAARAKADQSASLVVDWRPAAVAASICTGAWICMLRSCWARGPWTAPSFVGGALPSHSTEKNMVTYPPWHVPPPPPPSVLAMSPGTPRTWPTGLTGDSPGTYRGPTGDLQGTYREL